MDVRIKKLAKILVHNSLKVKPKETVLIRSSELSKPLVLALYEELLKAGANPRLSITPEGINEIFYSQATDEQLRHFPKISYYEAKNISGLISINAPENLKALSRTPPEKMVIRAKILKPINEHIMNRVRWVVVNYPTPALAQEAEMSLKEYEDFLYRACLCNWDGTKKQMSEIAKRLEKGDKLRIAGKDTDLTLSIKNRKFVVAAGEFNMPDGEIFTGPVEDSAEGHIHFEFPAIHGGREVSGIKLWFKKGKVIKATAQKNEAYLKRILRTDEGAMRIGELGIGLNYKINRFTKDILFDEKIGGTVHLALGRSYPETGGKNRSAIHWDMIKDLRRNGELYLDGKLIQKDGKFLFGKRG